LSAFGSLLYPLVDKHAPMKKCSEECGEKHSQSPLLMHQNSTDVETRKKHCALNELSSVHRSATQSVTMEVWQE